MATFAPFCCPDLGGEEERVVLLGVDGRVVRPEVEEHADDDAGAPLDGHVEGRQELVVDDVEAAAGDAKHERRVLEEWVPALAAPGVDREVEPRVAAGVDAVEAVAQLAAELRQRLAVRVRRVRQRERGLVLEVDGLGLAVQIPREGPVHVLLA